MQIRERGGSIEFLRYVKTEEREKKSTSQKQFGSMRSYLQEVPEKLLAKMTEEEQEEAREYIRERDERREKSLSRMCIKDSAESLRKLHHALCDHPDLVTEESASGIYLYMDAIAKVLRKAGHTKSKSLKPKGDEA